MDDICNENFVEHLSRFVGRTVTIFTTSGGQSGQGFTGVVLSVNNSFVRLITRIGPAPDSSLGNSGTNSNGCRCCSGSGVSGAFSRSGRGDLGSVTDIPIDRIACFVHDAV